MKKLAILVLALVMCLTAVSAMADFKADVEAGGTVTLSGNVTLTEMVSVTNDVTLNIGEHNIIGTGAYMFLLKNGANMTINGTGNITYDAADKFVFYVSKGSTLTIGKGVNVKHTGKGGCVYVYNQGSTLNVYGNLSVDTAGYATITGNGNPGEGGTTINIYDGATVKHAKDTAIYHPQTGVLNVYGGEITGETGIEMRSGTLNVKGGKITATGAPNGPVANGSGTTFTGVAVAVSQHTTNNAINVNISGGTMKANNQNGGALVENTADGTAKDKIKLNVTGGNFEGDVFSANEDDFISGGTFSNDTADEYIAPGLEVVKSNGKWVVKAFAVENYDLPQTGDTENMMMWIALMAMAAMGLVATRKMSRQ